MKLAPMGHSVLLGDDGIRRLRDQLEHDKFFFGSKVRRRLYSIVVDALNTALIVKRYDVVDE